MGRLRSYLFFLLTGSVLATSGNSPASFLRIPSRRPVARRAGEKLGSSTPEKDMIEIPTFSSDGVTSPQPTRRSQAESGPLLHRLDSPRMKSRLIRKRIASASAFLAVERDQPR